MTLNVQQRCHCRAVEKDDLSINATGLTDAYLYLHIYVYAYRQTAKRERGKEIEGRR